MAGVTKTGVVQMPNSSEGAKWERKREKKGIARSESAGRGRRIAKVGLRTLEKVK